jgi:hypothetical protein
LKFALLMSTTVASRVVHDFNDSPSSSFALPAALQLDSAALLLGVSFSATLAFGQ